ncbi:MAG: hypothetical protein JSU08_05960 [Acidobacteria bacterium]|nr:hypothetical protein [Acidobacteriota bacterium]
MLLVVSTRASGQEFASLGGPFSREATRNAPFSAEATTTVRDELPDGTVRIRTVTARYFRDSQGQVRAELDAPWGPYILIEHPGPERMQFFVLDPTARSYQNANLWVAQHLFNGEAGVAVPVKRHCFEAMPQVAEFGERRTSAERLGAVGADLSPELGLVRASHRVDELPVIGSSGARIRRSVEFALTNIRRDEPAARLFDIPADYTLVAEWSPQVKLARWAPPESPDACGVSNR